MMKWIVCFNECGREIISSGEDKNEFCFECDWEKKVEAIEINPESIRKFMETYQLSNFNFVEGEFINIEFQKGDYDKKFGMSTYHPKVKINKLEEIKWWEKENKFNYSVFLEKLFRFVKEQKIERIIANYATISFEDSIKIFETIKIEKKLKKIK